MTKITFGGQGGGGGVSDHGGLAGLGDDDHSQYVIGDASRSSAGIILSSGAAIGLGATSGLAPLIVGSGGVSGTVAGGFVGQFLPKAGTVQIADGSIWLPNEKGIYVGNSAGTTFQRILRRNSSNEMVFTDGAGSGSFKLDTSSRLGFGAGAEVSGIGNIDSNAGTIVFLNNRSDGANKIIILANAQQSTNPLITFKDVDNVNKVKIYANSGVYPGGIILQAPNSSGWLLSVDNAGLLTTTGPFTIA